LTVIKIAINRTNSFLRRQPAATEYFRNSTDIERHSLKISLSIHFVRTYRSNFSVFLFPLLLKILCVLGSVGPHVFGPPRCKCKNVANISKFFKFFIDKYVQISAVMIFIIWLSKLDKYIFKIFMLVVII
jgi:hypothetical protein